MKYMFSGATSFNQPIGNWDLSSLTSTRGMFNYALVFNQPLNMWNMSAVVDMVNMFHSASNFNQPIENWDVSQVTTMETMFIYTSNFNQPLSMWNTSNVTNTDWMFAFARVFDQPLGQWDVSNLQSAKGMFIGTRLNSNNYDDLLLEWSELPLNSGVEFDGGNSYYSYNAMEARESIIDTYGWIITDAGCLNCDDVSYASELARTQQAKADSTLFSIYFAQYYIIFSVLFITVILKRNNKTT